jgi:hypothetical protein
MTEQTTATAPVALPSPGSITKIRVFKMEESCKRTTFFVELTSDEGFTITPCSHCTGHEHRGLDGKMVQVPGLSIEEARNRALIEAATWADFLRTTPEPYLDEDGGTVSPKMHYLPYETRRVLAQRRIDAGEEPIDE